MQGAQINESEQSEAGVQPLHLCTKPTTSQKQRNSPLHTGSKAGAPATGLTPAHMWHKPSAASEPHPTTHPYPCHARLQHTNEFHLRHHIY